MVCEVIFKTVIVELFCDDCISPRNLKIFVLARSRFNMICSLICKSSEVCIKGDLKKFLEVVWECHKLLPYSSLLSVHSFCICPGYCVFSDSPHSASVFNVDHHNSELHISFSLSTTVTLCFHHFMQTLFRNLIPLFATLWTPQQQQKKSSPLGPASLWAANILLTTRTPSLRTKDIPR